MLHALQSAEFGRGASSRAYARARTHMSLPTLATSGIWIPRAGGCRGQRAKAGAPKHGAFSALRRARCSSSLRTFANIRGQAACKLERIFVNPVPVVHPRARPLGDRQHPLIVLKYPAQLADPDA